MRVPAGWISLIINAGEGIDVDIFSLNRIKGKVWNELDAGYV
mgnify:CR=1 FL=1